MRIPTLVLAACVLTLWVVCITVYPDLPARIPMQFGLDGHVNRWADTSLTSWFLIPTIATVVAAILEALAAYAPRKPEIYNYPGKEDVLALTGEPRTAAIAELQNFMTWMAVAVVLVFGATAFTIHRVAHERTPTLALPVAIAMLVLGVPIALAVVSARISTIVQEQKAKRSKSRGPRP